MRQDAVVAALAVALLVPPSAPAQSATSPPDRSDVGATNAPPPPVATLPLDPPTEQEISAVLERVRGFCVRSAAYRIVDQKSGQPITDFTKPVPTAILDRSSRDFNDWTYEMGVTYSGMLLATEVTGDPGYADYATRTFKFLFDGLDFVRKAERDPGNRRDGFARMLGPRNLDDCGSMTAALIKTYFRVRDERFREAIRITDEHISRGQFRISDGTLARTGPEPETLWLDDLYMSVPFLAQMGRLTGEQRYFDDGARQVLQMAERMFEPGRNLWDHNFYLNVQYDPRYFWARANGWAAMATVELLSVLPESHPRRAELVDLLKRHVAGLQQAQSGTGLWHELLDKNDSYLETSASAMFAFSIARAVNRGWVEPVYAPVAHVAWSAVARRVRPDGQVDGTCVGTNSGYQNPFYFNRPVEPQPMHAYGPVMLAGAEMIALLRDFEVQRSGAVRRRPAPAR